MKRLISDLPKPSVGVNCGEGSQATAVVKLLKEGGTLLTYGKRRFLSWCRKTATQME
jgi:hypothetical protein